MPEQRYVVRILWGEKPEPGDHIQEYGFGTKDELDAFIHGVNEATGWLGCHVYEPKEDGSWPFQADRKEFLGGEPDGYVYDSKEECHREGRHLISCDEDGYCNYCGEQDAPEHVCDGCGKEYFYDDMNDIEKLSMRVGAGTIADPTGECPDPNCGALCFNKKELEAAIAQRQNQ